MIRADMALYDKDGRLIALVEVKNLRGTSRDWAAAFRRNLLQHGSFQGARYFLVITPDRLYLWQEGEPSSEALPPTDEVDLRPLLAPYFERTRLSAETVSGQAFELIVADWLNDLITPREDPKGARGQEGSLAGSGLLTSVRDGRLDFQVAA